MKKYEFDLKEVIKQVYDEKLVSEKRSCVCNKMISLEKELFACLGDKQKKLYNDIENLRFEDYCLVEDELIDLCFKFLRG